ncbi:MAG TPA: GNAT family N-acetyltransferase [Pelobium sp.]
MMQIKPAQLFDAELIGSLANEIWPVCYAGVISNEQITFMLNDLYTTDAITRQMQAKHQFFLLELDDVPHGFASVSQETTTAYKVQKLYLLPAIHKKGAGKFFLQEIENYCKQKGALQILLNVNRNNSARFFYQKMGYLIIDTVDINYHKYVLNDYIMAKNL